MSQRKNKARPERVASRKERRASAQRDAEGRLHLTLHRDPSGSAHLVLKRPLFKEAWQNEVTTAAANTAHAILRDEPTLERAVELARKAMAATSKLADGLLAQAPPGAVACKAGCDHCCYQVVGVTPPEAIAIYDHLKSTLPSSELERFSAHLADRYEKTRTLSPEERFSPDQPCPFLRQAQCSIYEVRPLSCRGMNSLDAQECSTRLREPEARAEFLATGLGSRSFMEPIRAFHAVSAGLQLSLSEVHHLDMRPLDLIAAVHLLLSTDAAVVREWLAGQNAFESARGGDRTHDAGIRELSGTLISQPTDPALPPESRR